MLFSAPDSRTTTTAANAAANASRASHRWRGVAWAGAPGAAPISPGGSPPCAATPPTLCAISVLPRTLADDITAKRRLSSRVKSISGRSGSPGPSETPLPE